MTKKEDRFSLWLLLLIGFVDYLGVGLVFPLFALLLFHPDLAIVGPEVDKVTRGALLGMMIAVGPIFQLFSSTVLGAYSDQKGRRKALLIGLTAGVFSYGLSILAVFSKSLPLMMVSRAFFGISASTMAIVQASIADVSTSEKKARNFGLINMAYGAGFTLGPYIGGRFSHSAEVGWVGPWTPFAIAAVMLSSSLCLVYFRYRDTNPPRPHAKLSWGEAIRHLKGAFLLKQVRLLFLVMFLFLFGWDFFSEFIPVYLMDHFAFSPTNIANFYAYFGLCYALSSGWLIRPIVKRFAPITILLTALFSSGVLLLLFLALPSPSAILWYTPILMYCLALVFPTGSAEISNRVSEKIQGEVMGIYVSIQALALALSPLFSGALVGAFPKSTMLVSGSLCLIAGAILYLFSPWKKWVRSSKIRE